MADVDYSIEVQAEGIGTDATADEVLQLSDSIEAAERVLTPFDDALEAASASLDKAAAATEAANSALSAAEAEYSRLERASIKAGKAVEKAAAKGKDTTALQAQATAAAAAVQRQAEAVDQAKAKATSAAAAQKKLANAYKTLDKAAAKAASSAEKTERSFGDLFGAAGALGGPLGGVAGQISGIGDGLRAGGGRAGVILGTFALANMFVLATKAAIGLTVGLIAATAALIGFAVASDKATSKKLAAAWKEAGKNAKALFEGVRTDKLVGPAESMLQLLDKSTSSGKGLSHILETLLNPIIDGLVEAAPLAKEFVKGLIIGALKAIIFLKKLRNAVVRAIPKATREKIKRLIASIFSLKNASKAGEEAFNLWALPFRMFAEGAFAATMGAIKLSKEIDKLSEEVPAKLEKWADAGSTAAKNLIQGIISGLSANAAALIGAAGKMADSVVKAIKDKLQSKSPSRVMRAIFEHDVGGAAVTGLERATPRVFAAGRKLGEATETSVKPRPRPAGAPQPMSARGRGNGQATITVNFGEGSITINAPSGDAGDLAQEVRRVVLAEIDGAALQAGAGELATGAT